MRRVLLVVAVGVALMYSSACSRGVTTTRSNTLLDVAASIGSARHAAYWFEKDLAPETYPGATEAELGTLRARAQILRAEADKLDAYSSQCDLFKPKEGEPSLEDLVAWKQELDDQRIDLTRELQVLQVRLGLRSPEDAAMREDVRAMLR